MVKVYKQQRKPKKNKAQNSVEVPMKTSLTEKKTEISHLDFQSEVVKNPSPEDTDTHLSASKAISFFEAMSSPKLFEKKPFNKDFAGNNTQPSIEAETEKYDLEDLDNQANYDVTARSDCLNQEIEPEKSDLTCTATTIEFDLDDANNQTKPDEKIHSDCLAPAVESEASDSADCLLTPELESYAQSIVDKISSEGFDLPKDESISLFVSAVVEGFEKVQPSDFKIIIDDLRKKIHQEQEEAYDIDEEEIQRRQIAYIDKLIVQLRLGNYKHGDINTVTDLDIENHPQSLNENSLISPDLNEAIKTQDAPNCTEHPSISDSDTGVISSKTSDSIQQVPISEVEEAMVANKFASYKPEENGLIEETIPENLCDFCVEHQKTIPVPEIPHVTFLLPV